MGREVPRGGPPLAGQLGQHHPVLPVPAGDPQGDLHDQCHRVIEHGDAQAHAQPAHFSERRLGAEVAVPGNPRSIEELEVDPPLEAGAAELPDHVWRRARAAGSVVREEVTQFV